MFNFFGANYSFDVFDRDPASDCLGRMCVGGNDILMVTLGDFQCLAKVSLATAGALNDSGWRVLILAQLAAASIRLSDL